MNKVLKVNNLSHYYSNKAVLKKISFELEQSQLLCLKGKNGSGKSTLLRLLSGVELATSGEIEFLGKSIIKNFDSIKSSIGFNQTGIYEHISVRENLKLFSKLSSVKYDDVLQKVEKLQLDKQLDKFILNCSSGYRKRISFLLALINKPKLLLLDEPLVFLDNESKKQILTEIKNTLSTGCSVIIATHLLEEISEFDYQTLELGTN